MKVWKNTQNVWRVPGPVRVSWYLSTMVVWINSQMRRWVRWSSYAKCKRTPGWLLMGVHQLRRKCWRCAKRLSAGDREPTDSWQCLQCLETYRVSWESLCHLGSNIGDVLSGDERWWLGRVSWTLWIFIQVFDSPSYGLVLGVTVLWGKIDR